MTIAIGFKFSDGVLLCADTQHTYEGVMKTYRTKVHLYDFAHNGSKIAFTFSGSVEYAKAAIQRIASGIERIGKEEMGTNSLLDRARGELEKIYKRNIFPHPRFEYGDGPHFSLLMACFAGPLDSSHLFSTCDSVIREVEEPYMCLGAGAYLSEYLLKGRDSIGMNLPETVGLALGILNEVKDHVDGCGGYSELVYIRHDGSAAQILDPQEFSPLNLDSI